MAIEEEPVHRSSTVTIVRPSGLKLYHPNLFLYAKAPTRALLLPFETRDLHAIPTTSRSLPTAGHSSEQITMKPGVFRWFQLPGWGIQGQGDVFSDQSDYTMLFMILLGVVGTYTLFQLKLLPEEVAHLVAKAYFWPTLPFTMGE